MSFPGKVRGGGGGSGATGPTGPAGASGSAGATGPTGPTGASGTVAGAPDMLQFMINGGGVVIATGLQRGCLKVPFNCTITAAEMVGDISGSGVVDIWRDTYTNYPPVDADSITASAPVTISGALKSRNTTLTGWNKNLVAGDYLYYNVDSVTNFTWLLVTLEVTRT